MGRIGRLFDLLLAAGVPVLVGPTASPYNFLRIQIPRPVPGLRTGGATHHDSDLDLLPDLPLFALSGRGTPWGREDPRSPGRRAEQPQLGGDQRVAPRRPGAGRPVRVVTSTSPPKESEPGVWRRWWPDFRAFDVVVSNYNGQSWPRGVQEALEEYVQSGGGLAVVHAANTPFPNGRSTTG